MKLVGKAIIVCGITVTTLLVVLLKRIIWPSWKEINDLSPVVNFYQFDRIVIEPYLPQHPSPLFLLILVNSNSKDRKRIKNRNAIRRTWGNCKELPGLPSVSPLHTNTTSCRLVFFMAKSSNHRIIREESKQHNDILLVDYLDSYQNITRKLLVAFKWATKLNPKYVLKADDDVVIHVPALLTELIKRQEEEYFYGGVVWKGSVVRDQSHSHYVPADLYSHTYYPPFCKGSCYILSGDLLNPLVNAVNFITTFGVDDAYVGVLMKYLGVIPVEISSIVFMPHKFLTPMLELVPDCAFSKLIALGDNLNSELITRLYERFKAAGSRNCKLFVIMSSFSRANLFAILIFISVVVYLTTRAFRRSRSNVFRLK